MLFWRARRLQLPFFKASSVIFSATMSFLSLSSLSIRQLSTQISRTSVLFPDKLARCISTSSALDAAPKKHKRPTPAFFRFRQDYADKVKEENPHLKDAEIRKHLSDQWANLEPSVKECYRKEYQQDMEEFRAPYKKLPRKPPRHFSLFMRENFAKIKAENQGMSNPDIMRELGAKWRNLPFSEREEIRRKSEDAQKTYEAEIVEFEDQLSEGEKEFLNVQAKDKMKELKQRKMKLLNFPKKPGTAFIYFLTMERESFPRREGEGITQWTQRMAETWRDMSDDEKEMYRMANRRAVEKYNEEVMEWREKHEKD